ncbi:MAG: alpha/beta hydrolase [Ruminococcus flavefaciens]|nr:alpha/beta hydrolase [Ruminococcus flavefaciens]
MKKGGLKWALIYTAVFAVAFGAGMFSKKISPLWAKDYTTEWNESVGTVYSDIPYGDKDSNKFDLYIPADNSRENYGLVVYLHAGGFTSGDKSDDTETLKWLCSKGYVTAGINYTLFSEENPFANIYTQSLEIKQSIPFVLEEAEKLGYNISEMAVSGGSAGHCLAMIYAYRDAVESPVPVKMVFGAVGPSSFYPEDWGCYGLDQNTDETKDAAAGLFGVMAGKEITRDMFGTPQYDEVMKDISALLWVDDNTVPSLMAYGAYDRVQGFGASKRLDKALTEHNIPHDYIVLEHSGHGLQNDSREFHKYYQKIEEYLDTYMPVE